MTWKYHGKSGRLLKWSVVVNKNLTMKNDYMENSTQPYISMSPNTISFLHEINSELVINIWGYDDALNS